MQLKVQYNQFVYVSLHSIYAILQLCNSKESLRQGCGADPHFLLRAHKIVNTPLSVFMCSAAFYWPEKQMAKDNHNILHDEPNSDNLYFIKSLKYCMICVAGGGVVQQSLQREKDSGDGGK